MKLLDLSQPVYNACPNCPVHAPVVATLAATHSGEAASSWHMEEIAMASHTGSHLDAPLHKIPGGRAIDEFPLETFCGPAWIADLRGLTPRAAITREMLVRALPGELQGSIVLLATGWGDKRAVGDEWHHGSPFLSEDGASWLVQKGVKLVGIDHYSIGGSREPGNARTHTVLLSAPILILEDLRFPAEVFSMRQPVQFMALPVHFRGFSGSFCRPVLILP